MTKWRDRTIAQIKSRAVKGATAKAKADAEADALEWAGHYLDSLIMTAEHSQKIEDEHLLGLYKRPSGLFQIAEINWSDHPNGLDEEQLRRDLIALWVDEASRGDRRSDRALRVVGAHLTESGEAMPEVIRKYLDERPQPPPDRLGPKPINKRARNAAIIRAIRWIAHPKGYGLNVFRNDEPKKGKSACSIVAEALGMEEDAVVQIYKRWKRRRG